MHSAPALPRSFSRALKRAHARQIGWPGVAAASGRAVHAACHCENTPPGRVAPALQDAEPGALDGVLPEVLPIIEAELWGDVADEKEAGAFSGSCREARKLRAYDTYALAARGVTFRTHVSALLQPVPATFCSAARPSHACIRDMLLRAAAAEHGLILCSASVVVAACASQVAVTALGRFRCVHECSLAVHGGGLVADG